MSREELKALQDIRIQLSRIADALEKGVQVKR